MRLCYAGSRLSTTTTGLRCCGELLLWLGLLLLRLRCEGGSSGGHEGQTFYEPLGVRVGY